MRKQEGARGVGRHRVGSSALSPCDLAWGRQEGTRSQLLPLAVSTAARPLRVSSHHGRCDPVPQGDRLVPAPTAGGKCTDHRAAGRWKSAVVGRSQHGDREMLQIRAKVSSPEALVSALPWARHSPRVQDGVQRGCSRGGWAVHPTPVTGAWREG